jgi:hypothetical protein
MFSYSVRSVRQHADSSARRSGAWRLGGVVLLWSLIGFSLFQAGSASAAQQVISSRGPLNNIYLQDGLACNATHVGDTAPEFFGGTDPGSCGTFLSTGGTSYGPAVGPSSTPYTPVSQTRVTGAGTIGSPYKVRTVVAVGGTGLRITQTDSYVAGEEEYRTDIAIANSTGAPIRATLYHAGDCYLQNSDVGYGYFDAISGGIYCTATPNNSPPARVVGFRPLSGGSRYLEGGFRAVWNGITAAGDRFNDSCDCTIREDNGAGLSWPVNVPGNGSARISLATRFSPSGAVSGPPPPPVSGKAVDVKVVSGTVLVKQAGQSTSQPLTGAEQIRVGSTVDTTNGRVRLTSAATHGKTQTEDFYQGAFRVTQKRGHPLTTLTLTGGHNAACPHAASAGHGPQARTARRRRLRRRLWGNGHGSFGTQGSSASATSQGTIWLTEDDCEGTLITVRRGAVLVHDFGRRKTLLIRAPHSYFATRRK